MKGKIIIICLLICGIVRIPIPCLSQEVYKDVLKDHWAYPALLDLFKRGIIKGHKGMYMGERPLTRYEFAVALSKLIKSLEEEMVTLYDELAKVEYVDAYIKEDTKKNETALSRINSLEAESKEMEGRIERLEDRFMVLEQSGKRGKGVPMWLVIGTTVVAVTALAIATTKK